jgi:hydrogenase maturation factor
MQNFYTEQNSLHYIIIKIICIFAVLSDLSIIMAKANKNIDAIELKKEVKKPELTTLEKHLLVLQDLATLDPGTFVMGKGQYHVKVTANDIINAGRRLEELEIFNFNLKSDNEIIIKIVE